MCRALRSGCRSPGWRRRRRPSRKQGWSIERGRQYREEGRMASRSYAVLLIGLAATTSLTSACGDNGAGPAPTGLRLVNGNGATDTIQSTPAQALVVEVRSETGALASGTVVRFQSLPIDSLF